MNHPLTSRSRWEKDAYDRCQCGQVQSVVHLQRCLLIEDGKGRSRGGI